MANTFGWCRSCENYLPHAQTTLLRTAQSVLDRTPAHMLEEIILVDDCNVKVSFKHQRACAPVDFGESVALLLRMQDARFLQQLKDINAFISENPKVNIPVYADTWQPRVHPSSRSNCSVCRSMRD